MLIADIAMHFSLQRSLTKGSSVSTTGVPIPVYLLYYSSLALCTNKANVVKQLYYTQHYRYLISLSTLIDRRLCRILYLTQSTLNSFINSLLNILFMTFIDASPKLKKCQPDKNSHYDKPVYITVRTFIRLNQDKPIFTVHSRINFVFSPCLLYSFYRFMPYLQLLFCFVEYLLYLLLVLLEYTSWLLLLIEAPRKHKQPGTQT